MINAHVLSWKNLIFHTWAKISSNFPDILYQKNDFIPKILSSHFWASLLWTYLTGKEAVLYSFPSEDLCNFCGWWSEYQLSQTFKWRFKVLIPLTTYLCKLITSCSKNTAIKQAICGHWLDSEYPFILTQHCLVICQNGAFLKHVLHYYYSASQTALTEKMTDRMGEGR